MLQIVIKIKNKEYESLYPKASRRITLSLYRQSLADGL